MQSAATVQRIARGVGVVSCRKRSKRWLAAVASTPPEDMDRTNSSERAGRIEAGRVPRRGDLKGQWGSCGDEGNEGLAHVTGTARVRRDREKAQIELPLKGGWAVRRQGQVRLKGCASEEGFFAQNSCGDGEVGGG